MLLVLMWAAACVTFVVVLATVIVLVSRYLTLDDEDENTEPW